MKTSRSRRRSRSALLAALLFGLGVGAGVVGVRVLGVLEPMELGAYDWFVRLRASRAPAVEPRIAVVTVTERDLEQQGVWPLPDAVIAQALATIASYEPRAIGLDLYRDVPVPPGTEALDALLRRDPRIVGVMKFAGDGAAGGGTAVAAPRALRDTERVGFSDLVVDRGGTVRRALLFLDDGRTTSVAFALRLALLYLQTGGVTLGPDPRDASRVRLGRTTIAPFEEDDGGYVRADARGYQFLLDFRTRPDSFATVSLADLLAHRVDAARLRDRIVLFGVDAESVKDDFYTPRSAGAGLRPQVPGIEIHAHVASQLLRIALDGERPLGSLREWQEWMWTVVVSALGAAGGLFARSPWRLGLVSAAGLGSLCAVDYAAFAAGWWLPLVPPALAGVVSAGLVTAYVARAEAAERTMLMQLFSRHVAKEVAEAIWNQRDEFLDGHRPRSQRLVVTALFTDLAGFTTVSEALSPEALMEWLNEYMDAMAQEISRHHGVIRQYAGDSIVVVFGVPIARDSDTEVAGDAVNAVRCALAMEARLLELNHAWSAAGRPVTGMRVGIFTGPAVVGCLGSAERSEYVVVGDTMNTAARLEQFDKTLHPPDPLAQPCRILIGATTRERLGDEYDTEWVGTAILKGKSRTVDIYRVLGRAGTRPAPAPGRERAWVPSRAS